MTRKRFTNKKFKHCPFCGGTIEPEETYKTEPAPFSDEIYLVSARFKARCDCGCTIDKVWVCYADDTSLSADINRGFEMLEETWERRA